RRMERIEQAPLTKYLEYCKAGQLAYQVCPDTNKPVFYPRTISPYTGKANLEWRVSKGLGVVYSFTVVHRRSEPSYNVALIDLDEGFRMMSRVELDNPEDVAIG